ncbi:Peptidoglycan/LPS O-acetylase OafA/YrhL, contains acyltransferase and SGNH-hydrolase domains [Azotobacter beijerinckii]|uniref:Peptidoglycan/LPS O-acetylase OafA/YrhL, contains acyltransferase and SGNH-hydrolase domains n=1 Tax=Azotobacter beijerinckii TaxID=170623 RepID=A0A1H6QNS9_9GAMM|nr:acyltransferase [Azotobacter beijerinckii]SEI45249.1 Peptidoglycan/LPS O-acetylase OafA/YrhL, contains acyltransferase and SGNH-hydrolase domains [Azotobacter beijerinckii]
MKVSTPHRFYSLDLIRGLAALSVVFWHWQHFFYDGVTPGVYNIQNQPFYALFFVLYHRGWLAVDFFFSLSGFIFFWLYISAIAERRVGAWHFFVLRFSRLYPLHIATFIFVLIVQHWILEKTGNYFVYPCNDLYHAFLNIFMASNWGLEKGWAFNAPIWSVSIEILLYAIFFMACLLCRMRLLAVLALIAVGLFMLEIQPILGRGLFSFFVGGLTFIIYRHVCNGNALPKIFIGVASMTALLWLAAILEMRFEWFWPRLEDALRSLLASDWYPYVPEIIRRATLLTLTGLLFPLTIVSLALAETLRGHLGRRLAPIGNISYSSYLLHFPLQLIFFMLVGLTGKGNTFFYSEASMLVFLEC